MPKQEQLDELFLDLAERVAQLSKDPKRGVGSLVVATDNAKLSFGYNGFARGVQDLPERWKKGEKDKFVLHAELNALLNCPFDTHGCTLYVTYQPCTHCLSAAVNAGIARIVYREASTSAVGEDWHIVRTEQKLISLVHKPFGGASLYD